MKRAFTLIEILVSLAITLVMMGAVVALFGLMTDSVSGSRSVIEMAERLRACRNRLQTDLQGVTVSPKDNGIIPPLSPENDEGYFEYIEGPDVDFNYATAAGSIFGDADDVLMFTVRSRGEPFVGKLNPGTVDVGGTLESQVAEVIYFAQANGFTVPLAGGATQPLYTLYRRVLLVAPSLGSIASPPTNFFDINDLSVHFTSVAGAAPFAAVPNALGDLTKRENRFAHYGTAFPSAFPFDVKTTTPGWPAALPNSNVALGAMSGARLADDILLTNVLAFDVQIYDMNAPIRLSNTNTTVLMPNDTGFSSAPTTLQPAAMVGGYVNLGYPAGTTNATPLFNFTARQSITVAGSNFPVPTLPVPAAATGPSFTYDTWSTHYESDGLPEPSSATTFDLGTNGIDDGGNGIVDDATEFDTRPPFASPLRGIRVIIRAYEPGSQQVREVTVEQDFLPE